MRFKMLVQEKGTDRTWWEDYNEDLDLTEIKEWAENIVTRWNATLRPGESERAFIKFEILGE